MEKIKRHLSQCFVIQVSVIFLTCIPTLLFAQDPTDTEEETPYYLKDRLDGTASSMFGIYIEPGEFIIYPFFEYYTDNGTEYTPEEFGFGLDQDFKGKYRGHEELIFLGFGITDKLAIEIEAAHETATLDKDPNDPTAMPAELKESGIGDVEAQIRYRWNHETAKKPEYFSYLEIVPPFRSDKQLIGTQFWEFKLGSGIVKGFRWGTMSIKLATEYDGEDEELALGEYGIDYLKRVSRFFRFYVGVEGDGEDLEFISDLQLHFSDKVLVKINNAFGITEGADDYAPEFGIMFRL